jgi:hypothetical protein
MTFRPSRTLTSLATVFGFATASAFGKLPSESLPFAAIHVRTLPNAILQVILPARVSHDNPSPVLNFVRDAEHCRILS